MSFSKRKDEKKPKPLKSMFRSQFTMIAIPILVCILVLAVSFGAISYTYMVVQSKKKVSQAAEATAELASAYIYAGQLRDNWNLRMSLTISAAISDTHIMISDETGTIILCSDRTFQSAHLGKVVSSRILDAAREKGVYNEIGSVGGIYNVPRYVEVLPVFDMYDHVSCYIIATADAGGMLGLMNQISMMFVVTAALSLTVALVVSFVFARRQTTALREMALVAHRFSKGELKSRVNIDSRIIELNELEQTFNKMADAVESAEIQRRDFVANVSHDLKTPLSVIGGYVDGILDGTIPPERFDESLRTVSGEVKRLSRMIRSMLELSRLQARVEQMQDASVVAMESFDITELLSLALVSNEQRIEEKGLDVEADFGDKAVMCLGIKDGISLVMYNLIDNAIKFAVPYSTLSLSVKVSGQKAYISVKNDGPTIPPEEQERIFERFHKGDYSRGLDPTGSGLGLYIVKTVIDAHNENITVKSDHGVTEFTFTLPISK